MKKRTTTAEPGQQERSRKSHSRGMVGKPQELKKIQSPLQIVNVDAVVYHKKSGQIVTRLKKENFAIQVEALLRSSPTFSLRSAHHCGDGSSNYSNGRSCLAPMAMVAGIRELRSDSPVAMFLSQFVKPPDDLCLGGGFRHASDYVDRFHKRSRPD